MATGMTKTQLVRHLAEKHELSNKQVAAFLDYMAEVAIKETKKNGVFVVPGHRPLGEVEPQGAHRPQPPDGRSHQDRCQDRGEVPRGQGRQRRHRPAEEVANNFRDSEGRHAPAFCFAHFCVVDSIVTGGPPKSENTLPFFITKLTRPSSLISLSGFPRTAMMSA